MRHVYEIANMVIFKAYITSEVEVLAARGIDPKVVITNRLKKIEHLSLVIGAVVSISRMLKMNGLLCVDPLLGYKLYKSGDIKSRGSVMWQELLMSSINLRDVWCYILSVNDFNESVINNVHEYDKAFFEKMLDTPLTEYRRFAFSEITQH